jgi:hypothetical protein
VFWVHRVLLTLSTLGKFLFLYASPSMTLLSAHNSVLLRGPWSSPILVNNGYTADSEAWRLHGQSELRHGSEFLALSQRFLLGATLAVTTLNCLVSPLIDSMTTARYMCQEVGRDGLYGRQESRVIDSDWSANLF